MTGGKGVDVAIEAGDIASIGVHGTSATLYLEKFWSQNITITTRLVDAVTTPLLLKTVIASKLKPL